MDDISTKLYQAVWLCFLLNWLIKVSSHGRILILGRLLLWYQFRNPIKVLRCLILDHALFYLFFLKSRKICGFLIILIVFNKTVWWLLPWEFYSSDSWLWAIDAGCHFLDLAKAFDCVNHDILLWKLEHCGTREGAYDLLKSFLCGTSQKVGVLTSRG